MSIISCNTIKDLLPLYIDGVCSSDSIDIIEEHLKKCPLCEAELINMQNNTDIKPEIDKDVDKAVKTANKKIKKGKKKAVIKTGKDKFPTTINAEEIYAILPGEKITIEGTAQIMRIRAK